MTSGVDSLHLQFLSGEVGFPQATDTLYELSAVAADDRVVGLGIVSIYRLFVNGTGTVLGSFHILFLVSVAIL